MWLSIFWGSGGVVWVDMDLKILQVSCNVIRFSTIEVEGMNKDMHIAYCIGIIDRFIISAM